MVRAFRNLFAVTVAAVGVAVLGIAPANAATVDPSTLTPAPPPGAVCRDAGQQVICQTSFETHTINEPAFELSCGLFYETVDDVRRGIRWYTDGMLTRLGLRIMADDGGVVYQETGHWNPDGEHDGNQRIGPLDSPEAQASICSALT